VQYRRACHTELGFDAARQPIVVDAGDAPPSPTKFGTTPTALEASLRFSPLRPYASGYALFGSSRAFVGKTLAWGYEIDAWAIPHWLMAAPLALLLVWRRRVESRPTRR
jgi:hypothetical protein